MDKQSFDLAVLGAGPGGYTAAIRAAQLGKKVALIEKEEVGGVCLNKGCIPTKTFLEFVAALETVNKAKNWGIDLEIGGINFQRFLERKDKTINILINGLKRILQSYGIKIYQGEGGFVSPDMLEVKEASSKKIHYVKSPKTIIATGSYPNRISPFDFKDENLITSNEALKLKEIPGEIIIVGGGVIGCEFASIYSGLGTKVKLIEIEERLLAAEDKEISRSLEAIFRRDNIEIYLRTKVERIEKKKDSLHLELTDGKVVSAEKVLVCLGLVPNAKIKGLEKIGLGLSAGKIKVNNRLETKLKGIYAVGDVLGGPFLAHWAYHQGIVAAENAAGRDRRIDSIGIPYCIYTRPEIGRVGLTEEKAKDSGMNIRVGRYSFAALSRAVIKNERRGVFKIISDGKNDKILGIHILGKGATELIAEGVLAVKSGMTSKELARVIHAHPTFNEGIGSAAQELNEGAIHLPR